MNDMLKELEQADAAQTDVLLDAAIRRKRELFPEWEIIYYARKKDEPDDLALLRPLPGRGAGDPEGKTVSAI